MQTLSVADNGTTAVEFTDAEAHALRNVLPQLSGSPAAHALQRHLAMAHGEIGHQHAPATASEPRPCGYCGCTDAPDACSCSHG